jgi:hypothetical protein
MHDSGWREALITTAAEASEQLSAAMAQLTTANSRMGLLLQDAHTPVVETLRAIGAAKDASHNWLVAVQDAENAERAIASAMTHDGMPEGSTAAQWLDRFRGK